MLYNIDFDIAALFSLIILMGYFIKKESFFDSKSAIFTAMLSTALLVVICDIISAVMISYGHNIPLWINYLVGIIYYSSLIFISPLFLIYTLLARNNAMPLRKHQALIITLPAFFLSLLSLTSPLTHIVFYFDNSYVYQHGFGLYIIYGLGSIYFLAALGYLIHNYKKIDDVKFWTLCTFIIFFVTSISIQHFHNDQLIIGFFLTVSLTMCYFAIQSSGSYVDNLSGLYKRNAFYDKINKYYVKSNKNAYILAIDINDFKKINSVLGIKGGDELITQVANYIKTLGRERNAFRYNDDRFIVFVPSGEQNIVQTIKSGLKTTWRIFENEIDVSLTICQIPIFKYTNNVEEAQDFIDSIFLYAKTANDGSFLEITEETYLLIQRRYKIEHAIRMAYQFDLFEIYFQPIYNTQKKTYDKAEVLLRLNDRELGFIPPDEFIGVAEQIGLIDKIGEMVLEKTCKNIRDNNLVEKGLNNVNINLSTLQCLNKNLAEDIKKIIRSYNLPYSLFNFEMTESAAITSQKTLLELMKELLECGITFSMDDYGKGYYNSESIITFPFSTIKLDKSMLWNADSNEKAKIVFQSIVEMIKKLELKIVAEGAETLEQIKMLLDMNVDYVQGFYYSKPLPVNEYISFLDTEVIC